jgi:hypothetical protein
MRLSYATNAASFYACSKALCIYFNDTNLSSFLFKILFTGKDRSVKKIFFFIAPARLSSTYFKSIRYFTLTFEHQNINVNKMLEALASECVHYVKVATI